MTWIALNTKQYSESTLQHTIKGFVNMASRVPLIFFFLSRHEQAFHRYIYSEDNYK